MDWKKQYSTAVEKNRDWRDLYALVSGRKGRPSAEYVKKQLFDNKDRIIKGLSYFQNQELKASKGKENITNDSGTNWNKERKADITAPFLMNKLHIMTGTEQGLACEVLFNYLQYAFRGPPDSLQKLLAQNEEKAQAVIADLFCFYYRERMFILKILYHILINTADEFYSDVFFQFIREHVKFDDLYDSLFEQLKLVSKSYQPNLSCISHLSAPRYLSFWTEHNLRERVQLIKLLMVTIKNCETKLRPIKRIQEMLELIEESKASEVKSTRELPSKTLHRFYVMHIVQLIGFDLLNAQDSRWNEAAVFKCINDKIQFLMDRKAEEGPALLSIWFVVHRLTPLGTKSQDRRQFVAHTIRASNPWKYFCDILRNYDVMDDGVINRAVHYSIYQVAFLSVVNFGLEYVHCEGFHDLVALLVRDSTVLKHFWTTENDGLQLVLKQCEQFFPVFWKPVFDIYTSIVSHSEFYVNQIELRVEKQVKFTQLQTDMIRMEAFGNNVFQSLEPVRPFSASDKIVIPTGTRCIISGDKDIFIHWDFSISIWHVVKDTLFRWSQKMTQYPKAPDDEIKLLRKNVLSVLSFYNEVLKNRKEQKKIVFFAVDEMFSRIELYHERRDAELLNACLKTCTLLLKYYPKDVVMLLEVSRAIPNYDKVIMDYVQCAKGDFYHSNGVKTILELVEINSGQFTVLISYLEFILQLFELPTVFESWAALAGVQFVLRDVFPFYNQWIFIDERQRIHIEWLCIKVICCVLNVTLNDITPVQTSAMKQLDKDASHPVACIVPNKNLFANTALHHLYNWEASISLIHIVSLGDQQLFSWVESFFSWDAKCCLELISSVHSALSILNKCILFQHVHNEQKSLTQLEREIYKEPKETDTYRVVINVAGYVYNFLSPEVRYNSVKLISRFADNRHQSLMACIGMEANTMRQMYLKPLYSSTESEEIKVAVLELVTECIHKQASLAEAFLNALELKECVQKKTGEEYEGFVHIALSIIRKRKETPSDRAYLASVHLLHALWHERRTLVISYIRMREDFFTNFCYPLFHITELQRQVIPAYAYILTCLGTELFWYKDQVHSALQACITDLFNTEHLIRLSLHCTDQLRGIAQEITTEDGEAPTHTIDSTKILIAWKEFVYILVKTYPDRVSDEQKQILCIHTLNALANEINRQGNMLAISNLAELFLLLVTALQPFRTDEREDDSKKKTLMKRVEVALKKISLVLTQLVHHYKFFSDTAITNTLASCCRFFASTSFDLEDKLTNTDFDVHLERSVRAVCSLLSKELETFLLNRKSERTKQILPPLLCLGITVGQLDVSSSVYLWRDLVAAYHITSRLIEAAGYALQMKEMSDASLLMLDFLSVLARDDKWSFTQVDILELQSAWDSLKPPIQKLFHPERVSLEDKSVFEVTNWFPVYMRALNLVTALVAHPCPNTRELGFDFVYQHERFICDIFEFRDDSLKETALNLVSSALRLLWNVIKSTVPWNWKLKTTLGIVLERLKQYVATLVDLLGDPDYMYKQHILAQGQKAFPVVELNSKERNKELQSIQSRLLTMLIECMSVLKECCPFHSDILTADRLGLPIYMLKPLVEPRPPAQTGPEYHTLINLINLIAKRLASVVKDDNCPTTKLASCRQPDLYCVLELTVHYMIANTLLTILSNQMGFRQSIVFLRDLSTEAKIFLEYSQRLSNRKGDFRWKVQLIESVNYKALTWGDMVVRNEMEDSESLGCELLSDADSDNESFSQRSTSPDSRNDRQSKKMKTNQMRVPSSLQHFLPATIRFDPSFEPKSRKSGGENVGHCSENEDVSPDFILMCNHLLKQMFTMHGFDERSLRGSL